jgi:hypothetical protein
VVQGWLRWAAHGGQWVARVEEGGGGGVRARGAHGKEKEVEMG